MSSLVGRFRSRPLPESCADNILEYIENMFCCDQRTVQQLIKICHTITDSSRPGRSRFSSQKTSTRLTTGEIQFSSLVASAAAAWPNCRGRSKITCPSRTSLMACEWRGAINSRSNQSKFARKNPVNDCSSLPSRVSDMISPLFTSIRVVRQGVTPFVSMIFVKMISSRLHKVNEY